jgi:hypothetical protein
VGDCGQPSSSGGAPVASDALFTLRVAVGSGVCELCVCDVDDNAAVTAADALRILRVAVGQPQTLACPACLPPPCEGLDAPACGGFCEEGFTCAPAPDDATHCRCLAPCQLGDAPACSGSCEILGDPNLSCQPVTITAQGSEPVAFCGCLPAGVQSCQDAEVPSCGGVCPPGTDCQQGVDGCACTRLPLQGACDQAAAPACGGVCSAETICQPDGSGGCACEPYDSQEQTCTSDGAPACGGVCALGRMCAVDQSSCSCFTACELSETPACGGACAGAGESCVFTTASVGGASIEYCSCR